MADLSLRALGLIVTVLALGAAGCASRLPYDVSDARARVPAAAPPGGQAPALTGEVRTSDGAMLDLATLSGGPTVLIFSQDTCAVCGREADHLREALGAAAHEPVNVRLVTILLGAILEDAQDWKALHRVPWTVAIDPQAQVVASYCAKLTVPCNVVYLPGQGIVLSKNGEASPEELQSLTGAWRYGP